MNGCRAKCLALTLLLPLTFFLAGCGTYKVAAKPTSLGPQAAVMLSDKDAGLVFLEPGFRFSGYDLLAVADPVLEGEISPLISQAEMQDHLKARLIQRIKETGVFTEGVAEETVLGTASASSRRVLLLKPVITELDPGRQALRYVVGFGAGATKCQVEVQAIDRQTQRIVFIAAQKRQASFGIFGGDSRRFLLDSLEEIADGLAAFIKRIAAGGKVEP